MLPESNNKKNILVNLKHRIPWRKAIVLLCVFILIAWLSLTPEGVLGKADAVGYAVCHRIETRSFSIGDRQVPLCARCTGQYLGAMLSLSFLVFARPRRTGRPSWVVVGLLLLFAGAYAVDGLNSYIHLIPQLSRFYLYEPSNILRLVTGTGLGLGMGALVFPGFNETIWRKTDSLPFLEGIKDFAVLLLAGTVIDLLVLSENPLLIYPLALISAAGVLILLTMIYTMVLVIILKNENGYDNIRQLGTLLVAGFIIAILQISLLDVLRYLLTGSWSGFHFG